VIKPGKGNSMEQATSRQPSPVNSKRPHSRSELQTPGPSSIVLPSRSQQTSLSIQLIARPFARSCSNNITKPSSKMAIRDSVREL
jgi:hypothetical protein